MSFQYGKIPECLENRGCVAYNIKKSRAVLNKRLVINVIKLINMYLHNIICILFEKGCTSYILYKFLYPNSFSYKNISQIMGFIFSINMLNNKKYLFKPVEYIFLKRMRFYYNKLIIIILVI